MLAALLTLGLLAQPRPSAAAADSVEELVRRMQASVEAGRDSLERRNWLARHTAKPSDLTSLLALATLDRFTYRDRDAEQRYTSMIASKGASRGDDVLIAYALLGLGTLRAQQSRFADAEPLLRRAASTLASQGQPAGAAQALGVLGIVVSRTVTLDSALTVFAAALRALPPDDQWLRSLISCNTIVIRVRKADPAAAALARPAANDALRAGNQRAAAACLAALAQDYERRTLIDSALSTFGEVAELQRAARNLSALAITRQWQGYVLHSLKGNLPAARAALDEAVELGEKTGALAASAWASLTLANLALRLGDLPSSGTYARIASTNFATMGDRWGMLQARIHQGDVALLNRVLPAARAAYEQVARDAGTISPTLAVHAHGRLAVVALFEGDASEAERELDVARDLAAQLRMPEWRQEDGYARALIAIERGQLREAEAQLQTLQGVFPADALRLHSDLLTRLAEVHVRAGDLDPAVNEMQQAAALIDRSRSKGTSRELRAVLHDIKGYDWDRDLGFATAIHEIAQTGPISAAFRLAEQRRARVLLEHMAQRQALTVGTTGAMPIPAVLSDTAVRRVLPESTAVLAFVTGRGREPTTVFVLTRERLAAASAAPVDDHLLELDRFTGLVSAGDLPADLARQLGNAFLSGALALVPAHVRRLVVLADGPLHRIPFDALAAGDGRLLIDRFAIVLAPSASVAATWWAASPRAPQPRLLAFGDPIGVTLSTAARDSTPPRLPGAAAEAHRVARYARRASVFTGSDAQETRLSRANLGDVGVLHFATHAQIDEWSLLRSALLLAPGDGEDGRLRADELVGLRIDANLVVLSACYSGGGPILAGEGLQALTEPFLEAGASAVVATLWQIGDRSAASLIAQLYHELASGIAVGDALHRAKQKAREQGLPPSVWAAFTLTGDGRAGTALRPPRRSVLPAALVLALGVVAYLVWRTTSRRNAERR